MTESEDIDIEAAAIAIEKDAGQKIPYLRRSLADVKAGKFARVTTPEQRLLREARKKTGLSQTEFASLIATPVATLRDWEQGRFAPPGGVVCLLRLIARHPRLAREMAA
ncbi:MAG: type II toxin-antitoxin system MqsA family antitoxin [Candidatus Accumulibacter sp.]|jgi:putative transcriptional regulator|nr:type II toxin-antitoxin system MqsA family antitoxin [Accumulibacter sp.]